MRIRDHPPPSLFSLIFLAIFLSSTTLAQQPGVLDPMGYMLPLSGTASTTQFQLGPELGSGTSCGASAWPNGLNAGSPPIAGGPGFLYAAINQLGFGANPSSKFPFFPFLTSAISQMIPSTKILFPS